MFNIKKKLTIIFALVLILTMVPAAAFATGDTPDYVCYIGGNSPSTNCFKTIDDALAFIEGKFTKPEEWAKIILNEDITLLEPLEISSHIKIELNGHKILPPDVTYFGLTDVDARRWSAEAIAFCLARGIFSGNGDGTFEPTVPMTRAMTAQILYNMAGRPPVKYEIAKIGQTEPTAATEAAETETTSDSAIETPTTETTTDTAIETPTTDTASDIIFIPFTDAVTLDWFTDAVAWAYDQGLVTGEPSGFFCGDNLITREQFMTILFRFAQKKGMDTSARAELTFADAKTVRDYSKDAMEWSVAVGLINSDASGISPNAHVTREQIAFILMRFQQLADIAKAN